MPQMMPINWMLSFIFFLMIFFLFIILNYYCFNNINSNNIISMKNNHKNLYWKW